MTTGIRGPLKWLEQGPLWLRTLEVALRAGWLALHSAALHGDKAAVRRRASDGAVGMVVRWANYHHQTGQIALRAGVAEPKRSTVISVTAFGEHVARELVNAVPYAVRRRRLTIAAFNALWWDEVLPKRTPPHLDFASPYSLLLSGYKTCKREERSDQIERTDRVGLLAVAIAVRGIALMTRCELCFRWAIPGDRFCHQHSQSNAAPGSPRERSARYRRGRYIGAEFKHPPREPPACATRPALRLPRLIARLLWATPLPDEERTAEAVRRALRRHSAVLEIVGKETLRATTAQLFKLLSASLDPYEVNPSAWVWIIGRAARWNRLESALYGRPRRMQFDTLMRIYDATRMAESGRTKAEIAEQLGIRPSALSNWLRRGVAPELAAALNAQQLRKTASRASHV